MDQPSAHSIRRPAEMVKNHCSAIDSHTTCPLSPMHLRQWLRLSTTLCSTIMARICPRTFSPSVSKKRSAVLAPASRCRELLYRGGADVAEKPQGRVFFSRQSTDDDVFPDVSLYEWLFRDSEHVANESMWRNSPTKLRPY